jgi:hypothetical protein
MLSEEEKIFEEIKELLTTKVFPKVNATSQEAAEIVVECIKKIEELEKHSFDIDRRTRNSTDFADQHEQFIRDTIAKFDERDLFAFLFVSDNKCDQNIFAGSMPQKGLITNTIQMLINVPDTMKPVLSGIGFPPDCVDKCVSVHEFFEKVGRPNIFRQMIEKPDLTEEEDTKDD